MPVGGVVEPTAATDEKRPRSTQPDRVERPRCYTGVMEHFERIQRLFWLRLVRASAERRGDTKAVEAIEREAERVNVLGGHLTIRSDSSSGTEIMIEVPMSAGRDEATGPRTMDPSS